MVKHVEPASPSCPAARSLTPACARPAWPLALKNNPTHPPHPLHAPQVGKDVRAKRVEDDIPLDPFTAGVYVATMMATVQVSGAGARAGGWSRGQG